GDGVRAAMEPRPDGRGKPVAADLPASIASPQWSPGLMAGGRDPDGSPWESRDLSGDFERSQRRWVIAS
ncbi:MAG: hypothetical protein WBB59_05135, partial [Candidatus Microthrix parvicella]